MKLKTLVFTALALGAHASAFANWERVATCNGAAVDVDTGDRRYLQLVITDVNVMRDLNNRGLARLGFEQQNFVIHGSTFYHMDFDRPTGPKAVYDRDTAKGVFYPQDLHYFVGDGLQGLNRGWVGRLINVYREGDGISLQYQNLDAKGCAGKIVPNGNPEGGPGDGQWGYYCDGDDYTALSDIVKYHFDSCK